MKNPWLPSLTLSLALCWLVAVSSALWARALDVSATFPTTPKPSQHGPQRTDPTQGVPKHAYSPFTGNTTTPARKLILGRDFVADRIVIKFRPEIQALQGVGAAKTSNDTLNQTLADLGVTELEPVFPVRDRVAVQKLVHAGGAREAQPDLSRWHRARLSKGALAEEVTAKLRVDPTVEYAEPDYLRRLAGDSPSLQANCCGNPSDATSTSRPPSPSAQSISGSALTQSSLLGPKSKSQGLSAAGVGSQTLPGSGTDPKYNDQWHLAATKVPEAWAYLQSQGLPAGGNRDIIIAVIDTGVDYTHPDLAVNIWTNTGEIPGNGIDDDHNGFVDDVHGIDVISKSGNPMDDHGHGTHVAGIIAAQGKNNLGGVGVAYNCQIMSIKAAQYSGALSTSDIAKAINYAVAQGADVINMSFGGYARSQIEEDALAVAFGSAVLVAAAGNDSTPNEGLFGAKAMYPAAYNWVLGVMARNEKPDTKGDFLARFSNFDISPKSTVEYELMAPGVNIWSILPNSQYAGWDGTSMSAPLVSGVAALVRTMFKDKDLYSSRFIMGQIATTGSLLQGRTLPDGNKLFYHSLDASAALMTFPKPNLSYLEHWVFDTKSQSAINDNDGIVDSGETIDLAVVIRNHWGKADLVTVKLEPLAGGAFQPDPYVTMITDVVNYGAIGSFSQDDNGLIYDAGKAVTGVRNPFRFRVSSDCPNEHVIPFRLTITGRNGLDLRDTQTYTSTSGLTLVVQRGRELPRIISENMTLSKEFLWIISGQTLIRSNATVLVTQGAQLQFGSPASESVYSQVSDPYLQVEGTLRISGTLDEPVECFPSSSGIFKRAQIRNFGTTTISFIRVLNPMLGFGFSGSVQKCSINSIDHLYGITDENINSGPDVLQSWSISALSLEKSILHRMDGIANGHQNCLNGATNITAVIFDGLRTEKNQNYLIRLGITDVAWGIGSMQDSVVLQDNFSNIRTVVVPWVYNPNFPSERNTNNAFLSKLWDPNTSHWIGVNGSVLPRGQTFSLASNYWGTTNSGLLDKLIYDATDNFNIGVITYEPALRLAPSSTYPFVVDVKLSNGSQDNLAIVGAESVTYTVTFNRDMSTRSQPQVSFGPDTPATDYSVHPVDGGWRDPRTWTGTFNITPATGDGYQLIRVAGAVAADDPWLVTGDDAGRFRFEIITSGTESMNLQATGGEGRVDLSWTQSDFELLAGFSLYRSTNPTNNFTRLNTSLIPPDKRSFRDSNVQPGKPYFYRFTVVKTDLAESDFSNVTTATPLDTIPPVVTHTPVSSASSGLSRSLFADVTDNVGVQAVTLYFRLIGTSAYSTRAMTFTTGSRFAATLEGSRLVSPGVEYYIEASDGVSTTRAGNAGLPYQMRVEDRPTVTSVSPVRGPASGGTAATVAGSNFKPGATVTFGSAAASNVSVVSSSQITCVTPGSFPSTVDVTVRNADGQSGTLLRAFIFESDVIGLSLPNTGGGQGSLVQVPVTAANLDGLAAAGFTVTFDSAVLRATSARTGTLTPAWGIAANTNIPGQIRLSMASPGGLVSGSGTLALIEFQVLGASGVKSSLRLSNVSLNDGAIRSEAADGSFAVNLTYDVRGTVRHWNGDAPVAGVTLSLKGDRVYSGESKTNGIYSVAGAEVGNYVLTPTKSDEVKGITAFDASLVLQHDAGLIRLTGTAAIAADVNRSGSITSFDAFLILQKAVDLITVPFPGAGLVWDFTPVTRVYSNLTAHQTGQDFTAILLGDVSGNWLQPAQQQTQSIQGNGGLTSGTTEPVVVSVRRQIASGSSVAFDWLLVKASRPTIYSIDVVLGYDSSAGALTSIQAGPQAEAFLISSQTNQPGILRAGISGAVPIQGIASVLGLGLPTISGSPTRIIEIYLNEGTLPVRIDSTSASFDQDSDGDRQSDWLEILAGTNPQALKSFFGINDIRSNLDRSKTISWSSVLGKKYRVEFKNSVSAIGWTAAHDEIATREISTYTDQTASGTSQRIYRVRILE